MASFANAQISLFPLPDPEVPSGEVAMQQQEILDKQQAHERLDSEFALARRNDTPLSIITADINALKAVNDELGHDDGDNLLDTVKTVVDMVPRALRTQVRSDNRPSDIVGVGNIDYTAFEKIKGVPGDPAAARIGGDEFLIILPKTDEEGARIVAKRIHEIVVKQLAGPEGDKFRARGINVGLSVGTASLQPDMTTSSDLLRVADTRMYAHKMSQIRPLTTEEITHLQASLAHLQEARVRPRDLPRYIEWLGAQGLLGAEVELATAKPETPQAVGADSD